MSLVVCVAIVVSGTGVGARAVVDVGVTAAVASFLFLLSFANGLFDWLSRAARRSLGRGIEWCYRHFNVFLLTLGYATLTSSSRLCVLSFSLQRLRRLYLDSMSSFSRKPISRWWTTSGLPNATLLVTDCGRSRCCSRPSCQPGSISVALSLGCHARSCPTDGKKQRLRR